MSSAPEEDVWTSCPDVHVELVPPFRSQDRKQSWCCWVTAVPPSEGATSWLAEAEQSGRAGVWGLTMSWMWTGPDPFTARYQILVFWNWCGQLLVTSEGSRAVVYRPEMTRACTRACTRAWTRTCTRAWTRTCTALWVRRGRVLLMLCNMNLQERVVAVVLVWGQVDCRVSHPGS